MTSSRDGHAVRACGGVRAALRAFGLRFGRDRSGAAALEFAIVAVPFFGFILFIIQIALFNFSQQALDHATRTAARQIMTGTLPTDGKTLQGFTDKVICPRMIIKLGCANFVINSYKVGKSSDASKGTGIYEFVNKQTKRLFDPFSTEKSASFCLGGPGDYIFLDVAYIMPDFTGGLLSIGGSKFMMRSSTLIYNEPTISAGASC